jgi:tetratricopeptide (TPR) repeat protein
MVVRRGSRHLKLAPAPGGPGAGLDTAEVWFERGCQFDREGRLDESAAAFSRALALAPQFADARVALADVLVDLGDLQRAAGEYRSALRDVPDFGAAWLGLASIKNERFSGADVARMEDVDKYTKSGGRARAALEFALGKGYEDVARYADAFAMFRRANTRMAAMREPWNAVAFAAHVDEVLAAFAPPVGQSEERTLGSEVIFIVGMPRSGSTLTEQILASHSQVEGAGELNDLMQVVQEESARLQVPFPQWVAAALPSDWQRLGRRYLELSARWRARRPRFTDKQPYNWLLLGAARAMLPGAHFIDCRRAPLETCWSCYKQMFPDAATFSYDLEHIAAFWKDCDRATVFWSTAYPRVVRTQLYEGLLVSPTDEIKALLDFCGLPFEAACLDFHHTRRDVSTASAAQVRQPLQAGTVLGERYGALFDPLRLALGLLPWPRA